MPARTILTNAYKPVFDNNDTKNFCCILERTRLTNAYKPVFDNNDTKHFSCILERTGLTNAHKILLDNNYTKRVYLNQDNLYTYDLKNIY